MYMRMDEVPLRRKEEDGWHSPLVERFKCNPSGIIKMFLFGKNVHDFVFVLFSFVLFLMGKSDHCLF